MNLTYLKMFLINVGCELSWPQPTGPLPGGALGVVGALREETFILGMLGEIYIRKPDKNTWKGD